MTATRVRPTSHVKSSRLFGASVLISAMLAASLLSSAQTFAQMAYITNSGDNTVSVISTATKLLVGLPIPVGSQPQGVAVTADGSKVYVANGGGNISAIDTATNTVIATVPLIIPGVEVHPSPFVAVTPDGAKVYAPICWLYDFHSLKSAVFVIDTATNTVATTIILPGGDSWCPQNVAVSPDGSKVYVGALPFEGFSGALLVIATATDTVIAAGLAGMPEGLAVTPDGSKVYVVDNHPLSFPSVPAVFAIDTATNLRIGTIPTGFRSSRGLAVSPDSSRVYVTGDNAVLVIDAATNTAITTIPVGGAPTGVAVTPDGTKVYVANVANNTVSVIDTSTNMVVAVLPVGRAPVAYGAFIQPRFAGTRGTANCLGQSVSALAQTFGGLNRAAITLGFPTVVEMRTAVAAYCGATS